MLKGTNLSHPIVPGPVTFLSNLKWFVEYESVGKYRGSTDLGLDL